MKVLDILEVFKVVKFTFYSAVNGFDIAVIAPGLDGDSFVDTAKALDDFLKTIASFVLSEAADEL